MKRLLTLFLALVMCLSIAACGEENTPGQSTAPTQLDSSDQGKIYRLGEMIKTPLFEIVPSFTGYAKKLSNWPDENHMTPAGKDSGDSPYSASDGKVAIYGEMQIKYIGNEKSNTTLNIDVSADYDDGYAFDDCHLCNCISLDGEWEYDGSMVFETLSESRTRILRYCIEVPMQVETNPDKSLIVTISVNGELYAYDFRSAKVLGSDYNPRGELYQPLEKSRKAQIVSYLKNNGLELWGWYDKTLGWMTFTFQNSTVTAVLPINTSYQYDFSGTYEVLSGTILISWDYGQQIHLDYTFNGTTLDIIDFDYETEWVDIPSSDDSFDDSIGASIIIYNPSTGTYVTGEMGAYSSGRTALFMSEYRSDACKFEIIQDGDAVAFRTSGSEYLCCDGSNVYLMSSNYGIPDEALFILEYRGNCYTIQSKYGVYDNGTTKKVQYLDVYGGGLACYGWQSDSVWQYEFELIETN